MKTTIIKLDIEDYNKIIEDKERYKTIINELINLDECSDDCITYEDYSKLITNN